MALGADVAGAASKSKGSGSAARAVPTAAADITTAGPLEHVYAGEDLSCQVRLTGDADLSFYPPDSIPGDCGTFLDVAGTLHKPDFANHRGRDRNGRRRTESMVFDAAGNFYVGRRRR